MYFYIFVTLGMISLCLEVKKVKTNDERFENILDALQIIENEAPKNKSIKNIKNKVLDEVNYNERHFDSMFMDVMGESLYKYIKEKKYKNAFMEWKFSEKKLRQKDSFLGIDNFAFNFKRTFGITLENALTEGGISMKENVSQEELKKIVEVLDGTPLVDSYDFKDGKVELKMDSLAVLLFVFSSKTYIVPKEIMIQMEKVDDTAKKLMLIIFDAGREKMENETSIISEKGLEIEIEEEQLVNEIEQLEGYNMEKPYVMGDYYYFALSAPDWFEEFKELIYSYARSVEFRFYNGKGTPKRYSKMVEAYEKCGVVCTIPRLAKMGEWDEEQVVKILWEMLQAGIARFGVIEINGK